MSERTYISTTDTAKLIRSALKESFPGVRFSVRSDRYSMGSSIDVRWTDGPNTAQVRSITQWFAGAEFDSMQDLKSYVNTDFDGKATHFGADYVFEHRDYSDAMVQRGIDRVWSKYSWVDTDTYAKPTPEDWSMGRTRSILLKNYQNYNDSFETEMHRELSKRSQVAQAMPSKTMARFTAPQDDNTDEVLPANVIEFPRQANAS